MQAALLHIPEGTNLENDAEENMWTGGRRREKTGENCIRSLHRMMEHGGRGICNKQVK
jgi:hypothetical protein